MSGYDILTLEFNSREEAKVDNLPEMLKELIQFDKAASHNSYLHIWLNTEKALERYYDEEEDQVINYEDDFVKDLSSTELDVDRIAIFHCNDTSDMGNVYFYERQDGEFQLVEQIHNGKVPEKFYETKDSEVSKLGGDLRGDGSYGIPSKRYLEDEYGFEAWTWWDLQDSRV